MIKNTIGFAWRSLARQPARATLGILGVAAVGALLFDMLLLSNGLVTSMRDLLERSGFDIRVTATDTVPGNGPMIVNATDAASAIASLPSVRAALTVRFAEATLEHAGGTPVISALQGIGAASVRPWTLLRGRDLRGPRELVINDNAARMLGVAAGQPITVRPSCSNANDSLPPVTFVIAGIVAFPFDTPGAATSATSAASLNEACGDGSADSANLILVTAKDDPVVAAADITQLRPDLRAFTNDESVGRLEQGGFTYFRQISTVLTTVTISFALLLITVLLTVSVNQRLGEIAALRALGFSRLRVVSDVLAESVLIVGLGGVLSLPLGFALAATLDRILKRMPQIPENLHFFVFEPRALGTHATLLALTAIVAALYPMRIVSSLPIAATLRNEVID